MTIYILLLLIFAVPLICQQDPCSLARPFPNIRQRLLSNKVPEKNSFWHYWFHKYWSAYKSYTKYIYDCLQDTYIEEGWYGEPGVEIPTDPPKYLHCGTVYPAYIHNFVNNTDAQDNDTIEEATVYVQLNSSSDKLFNIQTKLCDGNYRVYNLKRTLSSCSSYCVGPANANEDIPHYTAPVEVTVELGTNNRFVFYCNFQQSEEELWYTVSWYINNLLIYTTHTIQNSSNLVNKTELHEQQILDSGTKSVGFQVQCSFRASFTHSSSQGFPTRSVEKFIGIEVLTPNIKLNVGDIDKLTVRPTAPIGCAGSYICPALYISVVNIDTESCKPTPTTQNCRIAIDPKKWNTNVTMDVNAQATPLYENDVAFRFIRLKTNDKFYPHRIWENVTLTAVQVTITQDSRGLEGLQCYSVCDPHMQTYYGIRYEHHISGRFTLFRNKGLQQEVQMQTEYCVNNRATCICGLVIRAGRQVYELNHCGNRNRWHIGFILCDDVDGLFDVRIYGTSFHITLSSRTKIQINLMPRGRFGRFLNVYIYPSTLDDFSNADGLCGILGDANGVFKHRDGTVHNAHNAQFSNSWRIPVDEIDLFDSKQIHNLTSSSNPVYPCNCPDNAGVDSIITCTDGETEPKKCAKVRTFRKSRKCKIGSITFAQDNEEPQKHVEQTKALEWINGWTEEKARSHCLQLFNQSKAVQLCSYVPNVDQSGPLENCILDIKLTGDTGFSSVAVESIKNKCYHEIISTFQNSTSSIFQQVQKVACANECNDHGVCTNGTCQCKEDYGGVDCSVNIIDAPVVYQIFNDGYCSLLDDFQEISVYGEAFVETGNTLCKIRTEKLSGNGSIQDKGEYINPAYVESISEAVCTLPKSRKTKVNVTVPEESIVNVYRISISNDGNTYSNESLVVVYNSVCQYCTIVGVRVNCNIMDGYCISGTRCYGNEELLLNNDCFTCSVNGSSRAWLYSGDSRCNEQTTGQISEIITESKPLWIIGAVLGIASLVLCCFMLGLIYKLKKIKRKVYVSTEEWKEKFKMIKHKVSVSTDDWKEKAPIPTLNTTSSCKFTQKSLDLPAQINSHLPCLHDNINKHEWYLPTITKPILILGSSNLSKITKGRIDVQIESYSEGNITDMKSILARPQPSTTNDPQHVLLHIGINNRCDNGDDIYNKMMDLITFTITVFPSSKIYLTHIPTAIPFQQRFTDDYKNLVNYNDLINNKPPSNVTLIPPAPIAIEVNPDLIHWTPITANSILQHWLNHLNYETHTLHNATL